MSTAFYETYRRLCQNLGKSDNAVAAEIGLSNSTVTTWRQGAIPRRPTIKKIADYFGITIEEMMGDTERDYVSDSERKKEKAENEHFGSLNDLYYNAVKTWSTDKFFTSDESIMIQAHFSGVLLKYKGLIEDTSRIKTELKIYLKAVASLDDEKFSLLSTQELVEQFLNEKLEKVVDDLKHYIDLFTFHFSRTVAGEGLAEQMPASEIDRQREKWEIEDYRSRLLSERAESEQ